MPLRLFALRFLCLLSLTVWVGGFTFYSAAVIPVLHDEMDSQHAGRITQRVTHSLNATGVAALALWWLEVLLEHSGGQARIRQARILLTGASTAILVSLFLMHRVMDRRLDAGSLRGFYPWHRAYLIASTIQWFMNLGLLAAALLHWRQIPARPER